MGDPFGFPHTPSSRGERHRVPRRGAATLPPPARGERHRVPRRVAATLPPGARGATSRTPSPWGRPCVPRSIWMGVACLPGWYTSDALLGQRAGEQAADEPALEEDHDQHWGYRREDRRGRDVAPWDLEDSR